MLNYTLSKNSLTFALRSPRTPSTLFYKALLFALIFHLFFFLLFPIAAFLRTPDHPPLPFTTVTTLIEATTSPPPSHLSPFPLPTPSPSLTLPPPPPQPFTTMPLAFPLPDPSLPAPFSPLEDPL